MRAQETTRAADHQSTTSPIAVLRAHADKDDGGCACSRAKALAISRSGMGRTESLQRALLSMQRTYGNQHAGKLLRSATLDPQSDSRMETVGREIEGARGGGQPLDSEVRGRMQSAFGQSFGDVRVHTDSRADALSRAIDARAFTTQQDVFFRHGEYNPGSSAGRELLAHELTHVVQQSGLKRKASVSDPSDPAELEAEAVAREVMSLEHAQAQIGSQPAAVPSSPISRYSLGDLFDDVQQGGSELVSDAKAGAADLVSEAADLGSSIVSDVKTAGSAVVSGGKSIASAVSEVADPEKIRTGLIGQTADAIAEAATADSEILVSEMPEVEQFAAQLGNLRAAVPAASAAVPLTLPALVPVAEAISGALLAIEAFIAGLALWEVVLIAAIVVALIALAVYLYRQTQTKPRTRPKPITDEDTEPKPKPTPSPNPKPDPTVDPIPDGPRRKCPAPTGYPGDPIDLNWFKPKYAPGYYPEEIVLDGHAYSRDERTMLPHGEIIGVDPDNWVQKGDVMSLVPEPENAETPGRTAFRQTLEEYGFDWGHRRYLQADHILDKEWGGSDSTDFANFWPMSGDANMSAGASTNGQAITFCPTETAPAPITGSLRKLKNLLYTRFFRVRNVWIAPP